jgi:predicted metalloenzyme YecM
LRRYQAHSGPHTCLTSERVHEYTTPAALRRLTESAVAEASANAANGRLQDLLIFQRPVQPTLFLQLPLPDVLDVILPAMVP